MHQSGWQCCARSELQHHGSRDQWASCYAAERPVPLHGGVGYAFCSAWFVPNPMWTAEVVDVEFGDATITLTEDGVVSDTITVRVS
jgi:hypothetical protein